jgi:hypothetical protein
MALYRAYFLDSEGHITFVRVIDCADDDSARREGEKLLDGRAIEIWDGNRPVHRLEAKPLR